MPLYFAYGANLDRTAMAQRCPRSRPLGPAWLDGWRFFIMADGYASIRPKPRAAVHGLLWDLAEPDMAALDAYEEIDAGLYARSEVPVRSSSGPIDALVYLGRSERVGRARRGYMEAVVAAAEACGLPPAYCAELRGWLPPAR